MMDQLLLLSMISFGKMFTIEYAVNKNSAKTVRSKLKGGKVVLASSSPRRKRILELIGVEFKTYNPLVDESSVFTDNPIEYARCLAEAKANEAGIKFSDSLIIGADTIVVLGSRILGKPADADQAREMLRNLRDKKHTVITAIAVYRGSNDGCISSYETTDVYFRDFTDEDLERYLISEESLDKAGSYGIQGMGSILVEKIEGELDNVIGLPLDCLDKLLAEYNNAR